VVFNETRDLRDVLARLGQFFAHESCGKCYPCQLGTQRQHEILERIAAGKTQPGDGARLSDVGWTMTDASLCGLGQTAASAVLSAMKVWPELFEIPNPKTQIPKKKIAKKKTAVKRRAQPAKSARTTKKKTAKRK
jgi:NADH:ubiquinone oxidoreductase subunit F (NADH-binding)